MTKWVAICVELVGIAAVGVGVGLEIALGGQVYFIIITVGSCLIAVGGVIWGKFVRAGRG